MFLEPVVLLLTAIAYQLKFNNFTPCGKKQHVGSEEYDVE